MSTNLEDSAVTTGQENAVFIPNHSKKGMPQNVQNIIQSHSFHMVMLKFLQARLQQYMNWELQDVQAEFRKGRGTWDHMDNISWRIEKAR